MRRGIGKGQTLDAVKLQQRDALHGMVVAAAVSDVEQAVKVIELKVLTHDAHRFGWVITCADGGGERVQNFIQAELIAIQCGVLDALQGAGMQELVEQSALDVKNTFMELGVFTFVMMIKATALQLEVRVEFRRCGQGIRCESVLRQRGKGLALFVSLHRFERHSTGRLTLDGTLDIHTTDIT